MPRYEYARVVTKHFVNRSETSVQTSRGSYEGRGETEVQVLDALGAVGWRAAAIDQHGSVLMCRELSEDAEEPQDA
jgi:hypothetical protein